MARPTHKAKSARVQLEASDSLQQAMAALAMLFLSPGATPQNGKRVRFVQVSKCCPVRRQIVDAEGATDPFVCPYAAQQRHWRDFINSRPAAIWPDAAPASSVSEPQPDSPTDRTAS